ncbi:PREDICTED: BOI-related E3 ubiquitin-protein ligase 1-like [Camelina sativa]|uniref:BOI-related E3 ubiquitin-protein ligase 1-like n=1 Tax=Camelina sativa TaxID=90675 RepID=A0ABM0Y2S4_CAMSA|nr:PREDICTED: BOI-related E3 ubiquitin-protein ligase 1-like [Camelina sativa]
MAVEARHMNLFSSQYITNRECVKPQMNNNNGGGGFPVTIGDQNLQYQLQSDLTNYNFNQSTKRQRDATTFDNTPCQIASQKRRSISEFSPSSLIDAELVSQIQQQNSEIDRFVAQQTETLRIELEARQRTQTRMLASAVQNAILKNLKAKDEEIVRVGKLNWVLQERVKSLYVENQIWRDLAQTNEATANNLRSNLEQVLAQVDDLDLVRRPLVVAEDDAESSCGSCCDGEKNVTVTETVVNGGCRRCGELTASVLVLPCRHLCLCTVCGSSALLQKCPVCDMVMNASVHVNMSS